MPHEQPEIQAADLQEQALEDVVVSAQVHRSMFFRGMTKLRNAVFHVKSRRAWRDRDVVFLNEILQQRIEAGDRDVVKTSLAVLLYDFTGKCFMGDLKIWPLRQYEEIEALDPELRARRDAGEASVEEVIEALRRQGQG